MAREESMHLSGSPFAKTTATSAHKRSNVSSASELPPHETKNTRHL